MWWCILEWRLYSLLKVVRETEELMRRSGIFDGLPYYVCRYTDLLVWCCDSLSLVLKFKASVHELVDLKGMIDMVICHVRPLHITGSRLRSLHNSVIRSHYLVHWAASLVQGSLPLTQKHESREIHGCQPSPDLQTLRSNTRMFLLSFCYLGSCRSHRLLQSKSYSSIHPDPWTKVSSLATKSGDIMAIFCDLNVVMRLWLSG